MNESEDHRPPGPRNAVTHGAWRELHGRATAPYRDAGHFAWRFARGKLRHDPVFRRMLERGDIRGGRVLDIGCGQGLMASLLHSCAEMVREQRWPAAWPKAPLATVYTGIELMPSDVQRAEHAVSGLPLAPKFVCGDMCHTPLPACDLVFILDVLHYVDHAAQQGVLQRVRAALQPRGRLLLRVGDAADRRGFRISQWVDMTMARLRGHRALPVWGRSASAWAALLQGLGFAVHSVPMSAGTPFANVLLVADLP